MKLVVGVPSNGEIKSETTKCIVEALFRTRMEAMWFMAPRGCYVHQNRNEVVEQALTSEFTHIIFIDSDMAFPPNAIQRLHDANKSIIGAAYNKRGVIPSQTTVRSGYIGPLPLKPFICDGVGAGFLLIKTAVFKRIEPPWFFYTDLGGNNFEGEDYYFCRKARKAEYEVWCDPTMDIKHIGDYKY